ncbi:MAG TPA: PAS domain S-box protein [Dongiaceae bacterium]|nr:PAS domain S-box protein [Dongiaceae bacterium]
MSGQIKIAESGQARHPAILGATTDIATASAPDFRKVVEALPAAVYVTDAEGRITYYNEAAAKLWGHRPPLGDSQWCGSWRLYWPDGRPMRHGECPMAVAIKEARPVAGLDAIAERPDGSRVHFMPFPVPLRDQAGALIGAVNMLIDITDRKQVEQRIQESEARYRGIFEGARVALWEEDFSAVMAILENLRKAGVTDLRGHFEAQPEALAEAVAAVRITDVNRYALELFEAETKEELVASLDRVFLPVTAPVFLEELVTLAEGRRRFEGEAVQQTLRGRQLNLVVSIAFGGARCERTLVSILDVSAMNAAQRALREQQQRLAVLNRVARSIASETDLERIVQSVTDIATEISGAQFGAFFYNVRDDQNESYMLYTLSGAPREAFAKFSLPRNTAVFDPTFRGLGPVRSDDIRKDPRYGKNEPHFGMPEGHLPVVSYLAVPVVSKSGEVHGGLFFGHAEAEVFTQQAEEIVIEIAAHAAMAIDNAQLLRNAQVDTIQRGRAEQDVRRLAAIIENSDDAVISKNLDGIIATWNSGATRVFGYTAEEAVGRPVTMLMPPDRVDEEPGILARIRRGERIEHYDTVRRRKDGSLIDISLSVSPIRDKDGKIIGASKIARDITDRKRAEQQQQLLVGEIKHRIKNTLATVQAIARQTLQGAPEEEREAFIARLMALANAQDLLTLERWNRAALRDVVDRALKPFEVKHSARFLVHGPEDAWLDAQRASLLTMALHELATNAVKYGSLSNGYGIVRLTWELLGEGDAQKIKLAWRELGGPLVLPPERKGFGSFLIERALQGGGGQSRLDFNPNGLVCSLEIGV